MPIVIAAAMTGLSAFKQFRPSKPRWPGKTDAHRLETHRGFVGNFTTPIQTSDRLNVGFGYHSIQNPPVIFVAMATFFTIGVFS
ncbi:hypothetical protein [Ottowia testudinis]|uniref:Uncharacterized protein n=1 Tax=Ottowia testudinis TaxID=2816950 RepID=A0A975CI52_9BURK|nr:hypothetical protein [Ottowia testudinis]QTD46790.1 hypothetical protein J1M35_07940 [Ottowia testudinis]